MPVIPRAFQRKILETFHDDATTGHLSFPKTHDRIKSRFFWPGLSTSVAKHVSSCVLCQHRKRPTSGPAGTLEPLPCLSSPFKVVDIDLCGPLPVTLAGHRWIITTLNHLTRYAETAPIRTGWALGWLKTVFLLHLLIDCRV